MTLKLPPCFATGTRRLVLLLLILFSFGKAFAQDLGANDPTFNPADVGFGNSGTGADNIISAMALQPNGKVLIGGYFTSYNGMARNGIARLNSDGTLDNTFNPGIGTFEPVFGINREVWTLALQPDGKVLIGGSFTTYNGTARNYIARLNSDGTLDNTFNPGSGANLSIQALALQPDGKVLIAGGFSSYDGTARNYIARLNSDGSLDNTFNPGSGANYSIQALTLQPDGKVLIGGLFSEYNGTARNYIARLNSDGTLDNTFDPGSGANNSVRTLVVQPDGKVLIGGLFSVYNGTVRSQIARLNADGTLDNTFNPGSGADNAVYTLALQPDGKALIGGVFTTYNGTTSNYIARLNANGTLDNTFNPAGGGAGGMINTIALQPDGKALIGGGFYYYNGTGRNRIARIVYESSPLPVSWLYFKGKATEIDNHLDWATATEQNSSYFAVERSGDGRNFETIGEVKAAGNSNQQLQYTFLDKNATVSGIKTTYYRLKQVDLDGAFEYSSIIALSRNTQTLAAMVFPNPFAETLTLQLSGENTAEATLVELTTLAGKTVWQKHLKLNDSQQVLLNNSSEIPAGLYLLKIQQGNKQSVLKVSKQ